MQFSLLDRHHNHVIPENVELKCALDEQARDIPLIEPNPQDWGLWISYMLEKMEAEAQRRENRLILMRC